MKRKPATKKPTKRKRVDTDQSRRFIETAKAIGVDETPGAFETAFHKVAKRRAKK